jgi:hypothetical protein
MTQVNNKGETHMVKQAFTTADLYGADGRPHAADIHQHEIYNGYLTLLQPKCSVTVWWR